MMTERKTRTSNDIGQITPTGFNIENIETEINDTEDDGMIFTSFDEDQEI